ncbi:hypothetical protein C8R47DRAFT_1077104 [Mycena vitilis]|nr:hypothetical protein C8R47DRAFT_1077104 [Mycena vitilis]
MDIGRSSELTFRQKSHVFDGSDNLFRGLQEMRRLNGRRWGCVVEQLACSNAGESRHKTYLQAVSFAAATELQCGSEECEIETNAPDSGYKDTPLQRNSNVDLRNVCDKIETNAPDSGYKDTIETNATDSGYKDTLVTLQVRSACFGASAEVHLK